ncbi:MAG: hypothetical protein ACK5TN_20320 [Acidobacteriota bacterium]
MQIQRLFLFSLLTLPVLAQVGGGAGGLGGFGGPAVLGRGAGAGTGQRGGADLGISFYAGVLGTYDSGLTGLQLDSNGNLLSSELKGVDATVGATGSKRLRRGNFGINYSSHYRYYTGGAVGALRANSFNNFNGTDQVVSLFTSRTLTKRSSVSSNITGLTTNRGFANIGMLPGLFQNQPNFLSPSGEVFDNRIYFASGTGEYNYQKTARLSFGASGTGMITRRTSGLLFGVNSGFANGNIGYRLSRRQTISAGYQFIAFGFTRSFGDTFGHGFFAGHSIQIGRRGQLANQVGMMRIESLGLRTVSVDPFIAALIGISSTNEVFYSKTWMPILNSSFNYRVNRLHSFDLIGSYGAGPGNGVINTARMTTAGAGYAYSGIRNLGLSVNGFYNRMSSMIGPNQIFSMFQLSASANRRISSSLFATVNTGQRKFLNSATNNFRRNSLFVSAGITWSPREVPVSIR